MEYYSAVCPKCGKVIQVPEDLQTVICNYCGEKFAGRAAPSAADGESPSSPEPPDENSWEFFFEKSLDEIDDSVTDSSDLFETFSKKNYAPAFNKYYLSVQRTLISFDRAYELFPGDRSSLVDRYAAEFGGRILDRMKKLQETNNKNGVMDDTIYLYVAFAVPSVLKFSKEYGDTLADALLLTWNKSHPRRRLGKATFEQIESGFRKQGICYITTAVTASLGLGDDCRELNAFRSFRDNWLVRQPGGEFQIMEYYLTAPEIVRAIEKEQNKKQIYEGIWKRHLRSCLSLYDSGRYEECRKAYTEMVGELREKWMN